MLVAKKSPWLQLMPGILALWLMPMVATSDSERIRMPEVVNQPWPALLAPDAELDPSIAVLQMRAAALARLLDAKAEEQAN